MLSSREFMQLARESDENQWSEAAIRTTFAEYIPENYTTMNNFSLDELRFLHYHKTNPQFYARWIELVQEAMASGRTKSSGWLIANIIRWEETLKLDASVSDFKIPNGIIAYYSRFCMRRESFIPSDFFSIRDFN